jgi:hypothetical protein
MEYHIVITNRTSAKPILTGLYPVLMVIDNKFDVFANKSKDIVKTSVIALNKPPSGFSLN